MADFDSAIAKSIEAQRRITEAARAAGEQIAAERVAERADQPITYLPEVVVPPIES